jgi:hypothetical protein
MAGLNPFDGFDNSHRVTNDNGDLEGLAADALIALGKYTSYLPQYYQINDTALLSLQQQEDGLPRLEDVRLQPYEEPRYNLECDQGLGFQNQVVYPELPETPPPGYRTWTGSQNSLSHPQPDQYPEYFPVEYRQPGYGEGLGPQDQPSYPELPKTRQPGYDTRPRPYHR